MCTVTYVPCREQYFITSSRDEKNTRKTAIPPAVYVINKKKLIYPKDGDAGGGWIALDENGNAAVLLNGAFNKHIPEPSYRMSRGKIFIDIISDETPLQKFQRLSLLQIEPFTLVLKEQRNLYECRWDGREKFDQQLKINYPYIWSSVTLYDDTIIKKKEQLFACFLKRNPRPSQKDILEFHQFTGDGDEAKALLMDREDNYSTVSITSMLLTAGRGSMKYLDIKRNENTERKIEFKPSRELV